MDIPKSLTPKPLPVSYSSLGREERKLVRERYARLQDNKCHHCGWDLSKPPSSNQLTKKIDVTLFPRNFFDHPVHLHHDHRTDLTIGAVHAECNAVLWQFLGE